MANSQKTQFGNMLLNDNMEYTTVARVIESWEKCRRMKGFEEQVGTKVLLK
jgi:hypothetical protein